MMHFKRGSYGSVSFLRTACLVNVFEAFEDYGNGKSNGWCIQIGGNTYTGFSTRRSAVEAVSNYI